MPAKAKQILITTESHEVFILRRDDRYKTSGSCPFCGEQINIGDFDITFSGNGPGERELTQTPEDQRP